MSLTIFIPATLKDTANAIFKALDPDTGGDKTFVTPNYTKDGSEWIATCIPDVIPLAPNAAWWLADTALLHTYVFMAYAERFPDLNAPSLDDCQAFSDVVIAVNDETVEQVAERFGYEAIQSCLS